MFIQISTQNKSQAGFAVSNPSRPQEVNFKDGQNRISADNLRHILRVQSAKMDTICLDQLLEMQSKPRGQANG